MSAKAAPLPDASSPCRLGLRIKHPSIDPREITAELGLSPEHAWACGEPRPIGRRQRAGLPAGGTRRNSYWCATLPPLFQAHGPHLAASDTASDTGAVETAVALAGATPDLAAHLTLQLWQLRLRRSQAFLERLLGEGGELSFVIEIDAARTGAFKLPPALTRSLGALGATLEFEFI